ncbi:uncharacterized protein LOC135331440 isoform X3 [Halichondria panicea]|uniref:uncharacterized protein LOC135331440 isoform X3 n=1 Tax=Halichondria panicea TaxID=6063 RepID=UPI00312B2B53
MVPSVLILSLLLSIQLSSLVVALTLYDSEICSVYSAAYGTPIDIHITCSVYHYDSFSCPNNTFFHEWKATTCNQRYHSQCQPLNCHGFVGMNLTYKCSFEGARLYRYKNGEYQYLNGSSVNYGLLLPEHAGLYECRNGTTGAVHSQNITVNATCSLCLCIEEIRIGSTNCEEFSSCIQQNMCCSNGGFLTASESYNFAVYANPADNVSVTIEQIEWLADNEARSDVDLGQYTQQNKTNPTIWKAGFRYMPYKVTNKDSNIIIFITASTDNYSYSVSVILHLSDFKIENTSLPLNTTVSAGQDAIFQCTYTYASIQDASAFLIKIDYSISAVFGNTTTIETCSMYLSLSTPYNYTSDNCTMPPVKKVVTVSNSISSVVEYTLRIPKVTADLSGSIVSCSVVEFLNNDRLQWRTSAHLTVIDPVTEVSTSGSKFAAFVVIILPVIVVVVFLVQKCRQRRVLNQNGDSFRYAHLHPSQSTLGNTEPDGTLCVQIIYEINDAQRNGLVLGEQVPRNGINNNGWTGVLKD